MAVSKRLRFEILRRDNHTCRYCGDSAPGVKLVVDHVIPEALGGTDDPSNLAAACEPCNSGKSSASPDASHVAAVDQDAIRWAAAIRSAAEGILAERQAVADANEWFREAWTSWRNNRTGEPMHLPRDWAMTVERFRSLGVVDELLLDAVSTTMQRTAVVDRFRYFCGVAWGMVREIQARALGNVADRGSAPGPAGPGANERTTMLAEILDRCDPPLPPWEYDRIITEFRHYYFSPSFYEAV